MAGSGARLAMLAWLATSAAFNVMERPSNFLYSTVSPKLRIQADEGVFRDTFESDIALNFVPRVNPKDYELSISSDAILSLTLKSGEKWFEPKSGEGEGLYLTDITIRGVKVFSEQAAIVATIIPTPTVTPAPSNLVYMKGTTVLVINGTNFRGKGLSLRFDPPLHPDDDYIANVVSSTKMVLTRRTGTSWRSTADPGPLKLTHINTGGGLLKIDPSYGGVTVAEVQADLGAHSITVEDTPEERFYQSSGRLSIIGSGFSPENNVLRFANSLRGKGVNYTTVRHTENELSLQLNKGSKWRLNPSNLPGPLVLLAVNAGAGFVPVGPTEAKKGRTVATIFEDPVIIPSQQAVYNMHTHQIWIQGRGFTSSKYSTVLEFDPPLKTGDDIAVKVYNRTHIKVSLLFDKSWSTYGAGLRSEVKLSVTKINTGAGPIVMNSVVGIIREDEEQHSTFRIDRSNKVLYQTMSTDPLVITGAGLSSGTVLNFSPLLEKNVDYTQTFVSATELSLKLKPGKSWHFMGGSLMVMSVTDPGSGKEIPVGSGGSGLQVAEILLDPFVEASERIMFASHSPKLTIRGDGFDNEDISVSLSPTPGFAYVMDKVDRTELVLRLLAGYSWVDGLLDGESEHVRVVSLDTGAGTVYLPDDGVIVAKVEPDIDDNNCDDSCEWALDGLCDDGSVDNQEFFDDDYGGYYGYDDYYGNYAYFDDDYAGGAGYYDDDDFFMAAVCALGTDCTDCGGPSHPTVDQWNPDAVAEVDCSNACEWHNDGFCDDARGSGLCKLGTDCADCGPVGASNFTSFDDDAWWDDDDDQYWIADDQFGLELEQEDNFGINDGAGGTFIASLEFIVYSIGIVVCSGSIYIAIQWYNNRPMPFVKEMEEAADVEANQGLLNKGRA
eukprot:CAMPEP_0118978400 /NCGR_PEP_ID=MMETSP1173-20130426/23555_1 /TAXON_ID=1034831 /ORGANISM="Rhizochromulina marina cf, Strain CCMP1243" /LENGTH=890 /DNA_ID=CAMNT_0006928593 /DNA_START=33 /DNA_END=2701 /DNA_ORIENTATION=+